MPSKKELVAVRSRATKAAVLVSALGTLLGALLLARRNGRPAREELESLTKDQLYRRAREHDIPGRSSMTKEELIQALRSA